MLRRWDEVHPGNVVLYTGKLAEVTGAPFLDESLGADWVRIPLRVRDEFEAGTLSEDFSTAQYREWLTAVQVPDSAVQGLAVQVVPAAEPEPEPDTAVNPMAGAEDPAVAVAVEASPPEAEEAASA
jgi:hypothetical protein